MNDATWPTWRNMTTHLTLLPTCCWWERNKTIKENTDQTAVIKWWQRSRVGNERLRFLGENDTMIIPCGGVLLLLITHNEGNDTSGITAKHGGITVKSYRYNRKDEQFEESTSLFINGTYILNHATSPFLSSNNTQHTWHTQSRKASSNTHTQYRKYA